MIEGPEFARARCAHRQRVRHTVRAMKGLGVGTLRWCVVALLLIAGARKLLEVNGFERVLTTTGFFPTALVPVVARAVPALEIVAAVCLALPRLDFVGAVLAMFLSAAFAGLHGYLYFNGILVPCGCVGVREGPAGENDHLWMGLLCLAMLVGAGLVSATPLRRGRDAGAGAG